MLSFLYIVCVCILWCKYFVVFWFEIHLYTIVVIFTITLYLNVRKKARN